MADNGLKILAYDPNTAITLESSSLCRGMSQCAPTRVLSPLLAGMIGESPELSPGEATPHGSVVVYRGFRVSTAASVIHLEVESNGNFDGDM